MKRKNLIAAGIVAALGAIGAVATFCPLPMLNPPVHSTVKKMEEDAKKDAVNPLRFGDSIFKITARCGIPDAASTLERPDGFYSVYTYHDREGRPEDCEGNLGLASGIFVERTRSTY